MQNSIDAENVNGNAALVTIGSLDQSADFTQYNTVFSQIIISDTGATDAQTGILAEISSQRPRLDQCGEIENANGTATLINDDDLDSIGGYRSEQTKSSTRSRSRTAAA